MIIIPFCRSFVQCKTIRDMKICMEPIYTLRHCLVVILRGFVPIGRIFWKLPNMRLAEFFVAASNGNSITLDIP